MTTAKAYIDFIKKLKATYDEREAENIADWVFENTTGLKKWERRINGNKELQKIHLNKMEKYLEDLLQNKPVQYILNECWFYKRKFYVNENVLIPRPETEELAEWIVKDAQEIFMNDRNQTCMPGKQANIIDIGTGSGCISITLKKELPEQDVTAIDISEKALLVAKKNAEDLKAKIEFLQINFLDEREWNYLGQYDIIVSNPPYIPLEEKNTLKSNVIDFEPGIALFVENDHPFIFYQKISEFAKTHLKEKGRIYVEVHEDYAYNIKTIFEKAGFDSTLKKDFYGKDRIVKATTTGS